MRSPGFLPLGRTRSRSRSGWVAPASIVAGSMVTLLPVIATVPFLPPFGLMMLLGWRLQRADSLRVWAPVPLGFVDDMMSGQPLGSAMMLWTVCFLAIDVLDTRLVWRDFWQDWLIATGAIGFVLIAGRMIASPFAAHVETALLLQLLVSVALFPLIIRLCARLGREPQRR